MHTSLSERMVAAGGAAAIVALLGAGLLAGLNVPFQARVDQALVLLKLQTPPPPPPPRREIVRQKSPAAKDEPSPRNLRNKATPVAVPPPIVRLPPPPPPIIAAPRPNVGMAAQTGASDRAGPGQGAGGNGNGTGGGGDGGNGDGDVPPEQIAGRLKYSDMPADLRAAGVGGSVDVRYAVETDGRVDDCSVTRSSGHAELDARTCELIEKRFRFRPSLDGDQRPVRSIVVENHSWSVDRSDGDRE